MLKMRFCLNVCWRYTSLFFNLKYLISNAESKQKNAEPDSIYKIEKKENHRIVELQASWDIVFYKVAEQKNYLN